MGFSINIYLKLVLTMIVWGGTFTSARLLANDLAPANSSFLRFLIASVTLIAVLLLVEKKLPNVRTVDWLLIVAMGATGVALYNIMFFYGLSVTGAIKGSLITATNPLITALGAAILFREKITLFRAAGFAISICGAILIISRGDLHSLRGSGVGSSGIGPGEMAFILAAVSWSLYTLLGRKAGESISPLVLVTYSSIVGTIILFFIALPQGLSKEIAELSAGSVAHLLYLSIFATVIGFVWFQQGVRELGAAKAAVFIYFMPVSAVVIAWLVLGETITPVIVIGAAMIISGIIMVNHKPSLDLPAP